MPFLIYYEFSWIDQNAELNQPLNHGSVLLYNSMVDVIKSLIDNPYSLSDQLLLLECEVITERHVKVIKFFENEKLRTLYNKYKCFV